MRACGTVRGSPHYWVGNEKLILSGWEFMQNFHLEEFPTKPVWNFQSPPANAPPKLKLGTRNLALLHCGTPWGDRVRVNPQLFREVPSKILIGHLKLRKGLGLLFKVLLAWLKMYLNLLNSEIWPTQKLKTQCTTCLKIKYQRYILLSVPKTIG